MLAKAEFRTDSSATKNSRAYWLPRRFGRPDTVLQANLARWYHQAGLCHMLISEFECFDPRHVRSPEAPTGLNSAAPMDVPTRRCGFRPASNRARKARPTCMAPWAPPPPRTKARLLFTASP